MTKTSLWILRSQLHEENKKINTIVNINYITYNEIFKS